MSQAAVVVMGAAGSGKTTVGKALAGRLGWKFIEGDDFHPPANVKKLSSGTPLTDDDRRPWLDQLAGLLRASAGRKENVVMACSALKESYRTRLRVHDGVSFVFLDVPAEVLRERVRRRTGHFVPPSLVESQILTVEKPADGMTVDATRPPDAVVADILGRLPRGPRA